MIIRRTSSTKPSGSTVSSIGGCGETSNVNFHERNLYNTEICIHERARRRWVGVSLLWYVRTVGRSAVVGVLGTYDSRGETIGTKGAVGSEPQLLVHHQAIGLEDPKAKQTLVELC